MQIEQIELAHRPCGMPTLTNFRFETKVLPELQRNQVHLKGMYYSVDPYMRMRMNEGKSYIPPFEVNQSLNGGVVAKVIASQHPEFYEGDEVVGMLPWATECIVPGAGLQKIDTQYVSASSFLGILGMPGLTAYFGLLDICKPKSGETLFISGAAGAVGLVVAQIAKIKGCRVIGLAGSDDKVNMLKNEFGFDDAINYKTASNLNASITEMCPNGVDMYFDNVGGSISDAVISCINSHARIAVCGQISLYNETSLGEGPRFLPLILSKSALIKGFIIIDYAERFPEGIAQLSEWVGQGLLKSKETIVDGFDQLPNALLGLFSGKNTGKMIVKA